MMMFNHTQTHLYAKFPNSNIGASFLSWADGPTIVSDIASGCLVRLVRSVATSWRGLVFVWQLWLGLVEQRMGDILQGQGHLGVHG